MQPYLGVSSLFSLLVSLPYTIQEDIIALLPFDTVKSVSLSSKYFNSLSARSLHARVPLSCELPHDLVTDPMRRAKDEQAIRIRQQAFLASLASHPYRARYTRTLMWEMTEGRQTAALRCIQPSCVWRAFAQLQAVTTLDLSYNLGDGYTNNVPPLFPNLRRVFLRGNFPANVLDAILHTSPGIEELTMTDETAEYISHVPGGCAWTTSLTPFLLRTMDRKALPNLRRLRLGVFNGRHCHVQITVLQSFLRYVAKGLRHLHLRLHGESWDAWGLCELFTDTDWSSLLSLALRSMTVPDGVESLVRTQCPNLRIWTTDRYSTFEGHL